MREWLDELEEDRQSLAAALGDGDAPEPPRREEPDEWRLGLPGRHIERRFHEACGPGADGSPGLNAVAAAAWLLQEAFWPVGGQDEDAGALNVRAARLAKDVAGQPGLTDEERDAARRASEACALTSSGASSQYMGVAGYAASALADFAAPAAARSLRFGVEPGAGAEGANPLDLPRLVDGEGGPTVLVHQPGHGGALAARALKAAFFEAVLDSPARRGRGEAMPLAAYVADEFHRFATAAARHGEQSFLDACRSFGCACVLACQGVSSVRHSLCESGAGEAGWHSVDVLLTNTATKLFFRTSERDSLSLIDSLSPLASNGMSLSRTRPPRGDGAGGVLRGPRGREVRAQAARHAARRRGAGGRRRRWGGSGEPPRPARRAAPGAARQGPPSRPAATAPGAWAGGPRAEAGALWGWRGAMTEAGIGLAAERRAAGPGSDAGAAAKPPLAQAGTCTFG